MRTPMQAMIWEMWRINRWELLIRIGGLLAVLLLMRGIHSITQDESDPQANLVRAVVLMVITATSLSSSIWWLQFDRQQTGFCFRLGFVRPVSTAMLVGVPMVYTMLTTVVCSFIPTAILSIVWGWEIPIVGPLAIIACVVAWFMAAACSPASIFGKTVAVAALVTVLSVLFFAYPAHRGYSDPFLLAVGNPELYDFEWWIWAALPFLAAIAFFTTVWGVERQRHGGGLQIARIARGSRSDAALSREEGRPFANPFVAQYWYEMRQFGTTVLLFGAIEPLVVLGFVTILPLIKPDWNEAPLVWLGAMALCPIICQIVAIEGALGLKRKQGALRFSAFLATRPLANDQLVAIKLLVIVTCSFISWMLMALVALLHTSIIGSWSMWAKTYDIISQAAGNVPWYWWVAGASSFVLLVVTVSSMLMAFGFWVPLHPRILFGLATIAYLHIVLLGWDASRHWQLRAVWAIYGYVVAVLVVAMCLFALKKALSAGFLGKRLFASACCLWGLYVISTVAVYMKVASLTTIPTAAVVLGASLLLVPLAATAVAPLALASHRHG